MFFLMWLKKMMNNMYGDESGHPSPDITYFSGDKFMIYSILNRPILDR